MDKTKYEELLNLIKDINKKPSEVKVKSGLSEEDLRKIIEMINEVKKQLTNYIESNDDNIRSIKNNLNKKLTTELFDEYKDIMTKELERIREDYDTKLETKADKDWVTKLLKELTKTLKTMTTVNRENEDAMFSKKPILNNYCASCDADIRNIKGTKADYLDWNKMPRPDSARIANLGQGFSRILMMMKSKDSDDEDLMIHQSHSNNKLIKSVEKQNNDNNIINTKDSDIRIKTQTPILNNKS